MEDMVKEMAERQSLCEKRLEQFFTLLSKYKTYNNACAMLILDSHNFLQKILEI